MLKRIVGALIAFVVAFGTLSSYAAAGALESPTVTGNRSLDSLHSDHSTLQSDVAAAVALRLCQFTVNGENPHISHSSKKYAVQSHGYWKNVTCPGGLKATVTTTIQKLTFSGWVNVGTSETKTVYSGGGRGKRSTGHYDCQNMVVYNTFRVQVKVYLHGNGSVASKSSTVYSGSKRLVCG